ncbi:MAG: hypothetical protein WDN47_05235 [Candidatus Doudnabacteria bacterium]
MALTDNDRIQELFLVVGDKLAPVNKKWWYALVIFLIVLIPFYYLAKYSFVQLIMSGYHAPEIVYTAGIQESLQIIDKKIFILAPNTYSGYVKIKNINLEWGVPSQDYTAEFKTLGGTSIAKISDSTFILPASEKLIVFPRFTSQTKPDEIDVTLGETQFIQKPDVTVNYELQRVNLQNNPAGFSMTAGIKNTMAFTVGQIDLPVAVYDSNNNIVAVNFTTINDVLSGETRTFTYSWPGAVAGAVRAEINPEINIFDRNIFSQPAGVSPFDSSTQPAPASP